MRLLGSHAACCEPGGQSNGDDAEAHTGALEQALEHEHWYTLIRGQPGFNLITGNLMGRRRQRSQTRLSALIFSSTALRRRAIAHERRARHLSASIDGERAAPGGSV